MRVLDGVQLAGTVIALIALDWVGVAIAQVRRDVARAVREIPAHQHVEVAVAPIPDRARGRRIAELPHQALHECVVIVVPVLTGLAVDLEALEIALHDEIDHTGDGVRTISRRGAAGDDFDAIHEASRNLIEIRRRLHNGRIGRAHAQARPSTSTKVRPGPSPRRSAVATPPAVARPDVPLPRSWPKSLVNICGSWLMMSLMSVLPDT
jgi:hypothetical protein